MSQSAPPSEPFAATVCEVHTNVAVVTRPNLYVEVEDGEGVVLPDGMTEADLLGSLLRQVLASSEEPLPGLPPIRTVVVPCPWCGVVGNHDPIGREAS